MYIRILCFIVVLLVHFSSMAQYSKPPKTDVSFKKMVLFEYYISTGNSIGDIDGDGKTDIVTSNKNGVFTFIQN